MIKKYKVTALHVTAIISATVKAENRNEAIEKFEELGSDKITEEPTRELKNIEVKVIK